MEEGEDGKYWDRKGRIPKSCNVKKGDPCKVRLENKIYLNQRQPTSLRSAILRDQTKKINILTLTFFNKLFFCLLKVTFII